MFYLQIFIISFLSTLIITPFVIRHFLQIGIVDKPDKRRIHNKTIPRMGGTIVFMIAILMFLSFYRGIEEYRIFLISAIIIAILGNLDDVFGLRWLHKLIAQIAVSSFITYDLFTRIDNVQLLGFILPDVAAFILIIFLMVGLLNAINFMDGLDGLVCGYSIISLISILALGYLVKDQFILIVSFGLIGSLFGFMKFNTYPAKIFLGDTGSLSLAFFLTYLVLLLGTMKPGNSNSLDLTFALMFFALPITDTLKVIIRRLYNKKSPFEPDKTHLHHKILGLEIRQKVTTFIIHLFSVLFVFVSYQYFIDQSNIFILISLGLVIVILFIPYFVKYFRNLFFAKINGHLKNIPGAGVKSFQYLFPSVSIIALLLLLVPLFNTNSVFDKVELLSIAVLYFILFMISYLRIKKVDVLNNLYIFFNILIFVALFEFPDRKVNHDFLIFSLNSNIIMYLGIGLTFLLVIFFVYIRELLLKKRISLFYGQDLLLIAVLVILFFAHTYTNNILLNKINIVFLTSFSVYSLYLISIKVYENLENSFYYLSYIIPLFTIILLFFYN